MSTLPHGDTATPLEKFTQAIASCRIGGKLAGGDREGGLVLVTSVNPLGSVSLLGEWVGYCVEVVASRQENSYVV